MKSPAQDKASPRPAGLYLRIPRGFFGVCIDHFLCDPSVEWADQPSELLLVPSEGANHVFASVPLARYPYVPDLVEDARVRGISVPVPAGFPLRRLTQDASNLIIAHPRAIAQASFNVPADAYECAYRRCTFRGRGEDISCGYHRKLAKSHAAKAKDGPSPADLGALWPLSTLRGARGTHEVRSLGRGRFRVVTPSVSYDVARPDAWKGRKVHYLPGVVFRFPSFFLEVVDPSGEIPPEIRRRADRAGWELWIAET